VLLLRSSRDLPAKKSSFLMTMILRLTPIRKLALRLSDENIARSTIDAGLSAHAANRLEQRSADEAARRAPEYAFQNQSA